MEIFKKPSELLESMRRNLISLRLLREEYQNKTNGEIFNKRHSYLINKIKKAKKELNGYCTVGTTKTVIEWELKIEKEVDKFTTINRKVRIYLDGRLDHNEVTKLIEFNQKCIVHDIIIIKTIKLGIPIIF